MLACANSACLLRDKLQPEKISNFFATPFHLFFVFLIQAMNQPQTLVNIQAHAMMSRKIFEDVEHL